MSFRGLILIALLLAVQACGFQLRGTGTLPDNLTQLMVVADNLSNAQQRRLNKRLEDAGATLHQDSEAQPTILTVAIKSLPDRHLVDSAGLDQTIVRISRQLSFRLVDASGNQLVDNKTLVQSEDLELDDNNLLSTGDEKQRARENIDDALFNGLMIQLRRL